MHAQIIEQLKSLEMNSLLLVGQQSIFDPCLSHALICLILDDCTLCMQHRDRMLRREWLTTLNI